MGGATCLDHADWHCDSAAVAVAFVGSSVIAHATVAANVDAVDEAIGEAAAAAA